MNKFYNVIAEMKSDEKYIAALKKRAKAKNPKRALAKTKEYHEKIGMELFEFIDKVGILREVILGGNWNWGAWNGNGLAFENDLNVLIFNDISENDIERVEAIYNAWKHKAVPFEYGSNRSEWIEVANAIPVEGVAL